MMSGKGRSHLARAADTSVFVLAIVWSSERKASRPTASSPCMNSHMSSMISSASLISGCHLILSLLGKEGRYINITVLINSHITEGFQFSTLQEFNLCKGMCNNEYMAMLTFLKLFLMTSVLSVNAFSPRGWNIC